MRFLTLDDRALATYLLEHAGVSVLAGSSFGHRGAGYLRLSYANSLDNIHEGIQRIRRAIAQL